jgi:ferredoxin-like protein FixX
MGMFIEVAVEDPEFLRTPEAAALVEACSVEIFERRNGGVAINHEQEDECLLCGRCLAIAGSRLRIIKRYE